MALKIDVSTIVESGLYDEEGLRALSYNLNAVSDMGLLQLIRDRNIEAVVNGFDNTGVAELATQIVLVKQTNQDLMDLESLALALKEHLNHEA